MSMTPYSLRGLPGPLPEGEQMLWQGGPDWRVLARSLFHARLVAGWFAALAVAALIFGSGLSAAGLTLAAGGAGLAVIALLAWAIASTTQYTLTEKRVVLSFGVALDKSINLPLARIERADIAPIGGGHADIALATREPMPLAWAALWPYVRPWRLARPEPMLRAVPAEFAPLLADALAAVAAGGSDNKVVPLPRRAKVAAAA